MEAADIMFGPTFTRFGRCAFSAFYSLKWLSIQCLFRDLNVYGVFDWLGLQLGLDLRLFHGDGFSRSSG
jgi:hypothetical protein